MTSSDDTFDMSDDVFEEPAAMNVGKKALNVDGFYDDERTASPTGYPGYKPPKEALRMYALENEENDTDGWKSYKIEDSDFDETLVHKVSTNRTYRCVLFSLCACLYHVYRPQHIFRLCGFFLNIETTKINIINDEK